MKKSSSKITVLVCVTTFESYMGLRQRISYSWRVRSIT